LNKKWEWFFLLQLTSVLWGNLTGPYGSGEQVPELLERLMLDFKKEVFDELFQEYLYHQNTIYTVTYAAVPYLVKLALASKNMEVRHEIYVTCGIIESCHEKASSEPYPSDLRTLAAEAGNEVCAEIYQSYLKAITELASLVPEISAYAKQEISNDTDKRYVLIADAAYRESRNVANMLLNFTAGDEYVAVCGACEQEAYLWPSEEDGHIQAFAEDPVFEPLQTAHEITPADLFVEEEHKLLAERAEQLGDSSFLNQLPYLAGEMKCPSCGASMQVWPGLLSSFGG
jgi:hypothetical protein